MAMCVHICLCGDPQPQDTPVSNGFPASPTTRITRRHPANRPPVSELSPTRMVSVRAAHQTCCHPFLRLAILHMPCHVHLLLGAVLLHIR